MTQPSVVAPGGVGQGSDVAFAVPQRGAVAADRRVVCVEDVHVVVRREVGIDREARAGRGPRSCASSSRRSATTVKVFVEMFGKTLIRPLFSATSTRPSGRNRTTVGLVRAVKTTRLGEARLLVGRRRLRRGGAHGERQQRNDDAPRDPRSCGEVQRRGLLLACRSELFLVEGEVWGKLALGSRSVLAPGSGKCRCRPAGSRIARRQRPSSGPHPNRHREHRRASGVAARDAPPMAAARTALYGKRERLDQEHRHLRPRVRGVGAVVAAAAARR